MFFKRFYSKFYFFYGNLSFLKGLNTNNNFGRRVKTEIRANSIAIPVKTPKYIVGIKLVLKNQIQL